MEIQVGDRVYVKKEFVFLVVMDKKDAKKPVKIIEITKRDGLFSLIKFKTASGRECVLYADAFTSVI